MAQQLTITHILEGRELMGEMNALCPV
jgi:hypothetical protein